MRTVTVKGFLTERKLIAKLRAVLKPRTVMTQYKLPGSNYLWDAAFRRNRQLVLVEYDGDQHYRSSLRIRSDNAKSIEAINLGCQVVRVPYWVQLDTATLKHYFNLSATVTQDFHHGFITTKYFPASFCELGVIRFKKELASLPKEIRKEVLQSLKDRIDEYGLMYVLPKSLHKLVAA